MLQRIRDAAVTALTLAAVLAALSIFNAACLSPVTPSAASSSVNTNAAQANPEITVNTAPSQPPASSRPSLLAPDGRQP